MKFIALVSGGKDSCFNILHCLNAGHELVAMANLHPRKGRPNEIDSYMFQTVGHSAVESLSQCCDVPLFRAEISENEEEVINELINLFKDIQSSGIEFEGVSVGAIGSTYQQIRVDRACQQLNLRSLTYLWQRPQPELLSEICDSGLDVRIIKVAGMGLGEKHLGKKLSEIEEELQDLHRSIGLHPCGEGGEYETMVFDGPFFKKKMVPQNQRAVQHSTDDVFYLDFDVEIADKGPNEQCKTLPVPPLLSDPFSELDTSDDIPLVSLANPKKSVPSPPEKIPSTKTFSVYGTFSHAFGQLEQFFATTDIASCYHVVVGIKDMSNFGKMNAEYIKVFTSAPNRTQNYIDPSRACVEASDITADIELTVFFTAPEIDLSGRGIHVQGLSYWAPASIGPYSQCRLVYGVSYVAGQIGLIPQSLELCANKHTQAVLALQNAFKVLDVVHEFRENWKPRLCIVYITSKNDYNLASHIWRQLQPNVPLVGCVVSNLPRGAQFEWSIQACDVRYFAWYIPESDEEDELYSPQPEFMDISSAGFTHRAGFQVLRVQKDPTDKFMLKFTTNRDILSPVNSTAGLTMPVKSLFLIDNEVEELSVTY